MNRLENELGKLLQRKDPPEGFTERVLARIEVQPASQNAGRREKHRPFPKLWMGWAAAIAACLILAVSLGIQQRLQRERAEADLAGQQATLALQISSQQFNAAMQQAREATDQALAAITQK